MDKENKKFKFANVSNVRILTPSVDVDCVFNSTVNNAGGILPNDADLSCISSIGSLTPYANFRNINCEALMTPSSYKTADSNEIITSANEIQAMQTEFDCLYMQLLVTKIMKENIKKNFREEEENAMKEMFEIYKANETLKKNCSELELEEKFVDNLLEMVQFMDNFNEWIVKNRENLNDFKDEYCKLAEKCSKAKDYLDLVNINIQNFVTFEKTLSEELKKTCDIVDLIIKAHPDKKIYAPELKNDSKIDFRLLEDLTSQYKILKEKMIKLNGFGCI
ncbi:hypothetical protein BpHYR1_040935 [Brachionus plicatilis]|uniref:Uncharacterized protein n=1 Tax=Brachionus plicatilis TaxID=10195 RepID=A0A3M7STG9_BRAPC|nr:hypothetical protein BpHYR1_040935 [Brachionus plicatilis]